MKYYIYILECVNQTFYTGITNNLKRRVSEHTNGLSLFTKGRLPVNLVYYENANARIEARKREVIIKDMSRKKKLALIEKFALVHFDNEVYFARSKKFTSSD